jgi:hypothetical protein
MRKIEKKGWVIIEQNPNSYLFISPTGQTFTTTQQEFWDLMGIGGNVVLFPQNIWQEIPNHQTTTS